MFAQISDILLIKKYYTKTTPIIGAQKILRTACEEWQSRLRWQLCLLKSYLQTRVTKVNHEFVRLYQSTLKLYIVTPFFIRSHERTRAFRLPCEPSRGSFSYTSHWNTSKKILKWASQSSTGMKKRMISGKNHPSSSRRQINPKALYQHSNIPGPAEVSSRYINKRRIGGVRRNVKKAREMHFFDKLLHDCHHFWLFLKNTSAKNCQVRFRSIIRLINPYTRYREANQPLQKERNLAKMILLQNFSKKLLIT